MLNVLQVQSALGSSLNVRFLQLSSAAPCAADQQAKYRGDQQRHCMEPHAAPAIAECMQIDNKMLGITCALQLRAQLRCMQMCTRS